MNNKNLFEECNKYFWNKISANEGGILLKGFQMKTMTTNKIGDNYDKNVICVNRHGQ